MPSSPPLNLRLDGFSLISFRISPTRARPFQRDILRMQTLDDLEARVQEWCDLENAAAEAEDMVWKATFPAQLVTLQREATEKRLVADAALAALLGSPARSMRAAERPQKLPFIGAASMGLLYG